MATLFEQLMRCQVWNAILFLNFFQMCLYIFNMFHVDVILQITFILEQFLIVLLTFFYYYINASVPHSGVGNYLLYI